MRTTYIADDEDGNAHINQADKLACLLYTSDAADERSSVDLGGRRIIKKKKSIERLGHAVYKKQQGATHRRMELIKKRRNERDV